MSQRMFFPGFGSLGIGAPAVLACAAVMLLAQSDTKKVGKDPVRSFYAQLAANPDGPLPPENELESIASRIAAEPKTEIEGDLPYVARALASRNTVVVKYALSGVFALSQREDSAALLQPYVSNLTALLQSQDEDVANSTVAILSYLRPIPPKEVMPPLRGLLCDNSRPALAQVSSLSVLLRLAPHDERTLSCMLYFLNSRLPTEYRMNALSALGRPEVKDVRIREWVASNLEAQDANLRAKAINVLAQMGPEAIRQNQRKISSLANDPDQPEEIRSAATKALAEAAHS